MPKPVKVDTVKEIEKKLQERPTAVLIKNKGLTVPDVTDLRKKLRDAGIEYKVYKNTLFLRAATQLQYTGLESAMTGPTAIAFSAEPITPSKIMTAFAKTNPAIEITGALYEKKFVGPDMVQRFSSMLGRQEVITQIACMLNQPISSFVRVLDAVRVQKEGTK